MNLHSLSLLHRLVRCMFGAMLALASTHCASVPREVALHTQLPATQSARAQEGVGAQLSVRSARQARALSLTPSASFSASSRASLSLEFGVDLRLQLDPRRFTLPLPLIMSAGFDALNLGCQGLARCHIGTAGVRGEVGVVILDTTQSMWSISIGLDQDVRFGPRSSTAALAGVRWTQKRSVE